MRKSAQHFSRLSDRTGSQGGLEPRSPLSPQTDARKGPSGMRLLLLFIKGLAHTHSRQRGTVRSSLTTGLFSFPPPLTLLPPPFLHLLSSSHSGPPNISTWISNRYLDMPNWTLAFPAQTASSTVFSISETATPYYQAKILRVLDSTVLSPLIHQQWLWLYKWESATPSSEYPY